MHGTLTFVLIPSQQSKPPPAKETVVSSSTGVLVLGETYFVLPVVCKKLFCTSFTLWDKPKTWPFNLILLVIRLTPELTVENY